MAGNVNHLTKDFNRFLFSCIIRMSFWTDTFIIIAVGRNFGRPTLGAYQEEQIPAP